MNKSNRIQRQNCAFDIEKPTFIIEDRQSSIDSGTTVKSSTITEGQTSTLSNDSKNSSGSQNTNSTDKTSSSQGSAEIEEKERTFGSINLHPLPDTQNKSLSDCYRYINQRLVNVQETNLSKNLAFRKCPVYDKPISPPTNVESSSDQQSDNNKPKARTTRIAEYILERTIGKGNFAVVKLATHSVIKTKTAVKIMNKSLLGMNNLEKVTREIEAMKRLEHPHIVKLYQVLETDSKIFMVMEYAEKGEVFDHISHAHAFTEKDARELFWQVVCAINYCHKSSVVHRDLKAENLLLNANYQIKVADFGFCNFFEMHKLLSTHCGSPQYAAPEVFKGELYDGPLADVWSLGVVLYIMVCGSFPFPGESLGDIRNQVLRGLVRFPFFLSTSCEYLVRGMLQVDPAKRFRIEQIISTPWMQASNNVDKYRALMEIYNKKAIENKFEEIFYRQHPEHCDIIREQMYHSSKIKLDSAIQLALHMNGYDEDEIRNSVLNRLFDRNYAAYHLLKDKVCRFFNNPLLTLYLEATHSSIVNSSNDDLDFQMINNIPDILSTVGEDTRQDLETLNKTQGSCGKKIYSCRRNSLSYFKNKFYSNSDVTIMAKLYSWVLHSDEEYLLNKDQSSLIDQNLALQLNVRRHTVQLTEMPNQLRTVSNLASISPGFPKTTVQKTKDENKDDSESKVKVGSVFRKKQMSLDSNRCQTTSKLNQQHANPKLVKSRYLADIRNNESGNLNYPTQQTYLSIKSGLSQLAEIAENPSIMDSNSTIDNDDLYVIDSNPHDVVMGSNDSTNWTVMKNLPQLNLPVNLPALVHQPMARFTVKDPHLLAPPDFMTPYNSCFPRRSSDGAADMQPLHRSNPGVGGSYPEQSAHKYRSQNEFLYDAVVKQMVPSTKENYINEISPLEFMGLHLKRFSLPMNGSYNIQHTLYNEEARFNSCLETKFNQSNYSDSPMGNRRGSEDSQMSLWHKRVARSGYIDSGSPRASMFASAPSSRGGSPYPTKSCSNSGASMHSNVHHRKKSCKYRSTDHLSRNYNILPFEPANSKERIIPKLYETCEVAQDSFISNTNPSQPGLDLQELKAELQNLTTITSYKDDNAKPQSNSSLMIIPSISLSPIEQDDLHEDSIGDYSTKSASSKNKFTYSLDERKTLVPDSISCSNTAQPEESHQTFESSPISTSTDDSKHPTSTSQMYFHWFPGFIHSISKMPNSEFKIKSNMQLAGVDTKVDCSLLNYQQPLPLPYYSPFMRDEDAADLAAIERVNRKISQNDQFNLKFPKKDKVTLIDSSVREIQPIWTKPDSDEIKEDTKFGSCDINLKPNISIHESHSAMELSVVNLNRQRLLKRQLIRGFSAEETHLFSIDKDNGSMDCDTDQKLSIIQEQMDSS